MVDYLPIFDQIQAYAEERGYPITRYENDWGNFTSQCGTPVKYLQIYNKCGHKTFSIYYDEDNVIGGGGSPYYQVYDFVGVPKRFIKNEEQLLLDYVFDKLDRLFKCF